MAEAVREAERDAEASQAAREGGEASAAKQRDEETQRGMEATGRRVGLHKAKATATALQTPEHAAQRRRLKIDGEGAGRNRRH